MYSFSVANQQTRKTKIASIPLSCQHFEVFSLGMSSAGTVSMFILKVASIDSLYCAVANISICAAWRCKLGCNH